MDYFHTRLYYINTHKIISIHIKLYLISKRYKRQRTSFLPLWPDFAFCDQQWLWEGIVVVFFLVVGCCFFSGSRYSGFVSGFDIKKSLLQMTFEGLTGEVAFRIVESSGLKSINVLSYFAIKFFNSRIVFFWCTIWMACWSFFKFSFWRWLRTTVLIINSSN